MPHGHCGDAVPVPILTCARVCVCVCVTIRAGESPHREEGSAESQRGAGERSEGGVGGEDVPPPHSQLGTVGFIYLFYSEISQTWDWSLPEPGARGTNPGPTYHLLKCNYQMRLNE